LIIFSYLFYCIFSSTYKFGLLLIILKKIKNKLEENVNILS
jgi:hypothetical protein